MGKRDVLMVNGQPYPVRPLDHQTLLEVLRYSLRLTGTKQGCDKGDCGACTVLIDGCPKLSCCMLAGDLSSDAQITTIEGLQSQNHLDVVQQAFDVSGALQCGFCQPGMMLSARALLNRNQDPSVDDIKTALSGNLCRCTGYTQIIDAVLLAAQMEQGKQDTPVETLGHLGDRAPKVDGVSKVTGALQYTDDFQFPNMLHCKILRSPHAHARVRKVDTSKAASLPGVHAVLTGEQLPITFGVLPWSRDEVALAVDKVRFVGDEIAAVAAETEAIAADALSLISVEYELLEAAFDPTAARTLVGETIHTTKKGQNLHKEVELEFGEVEPAFEVADVVISGQYDFHGSAHAPIEPHCSVATFDSRNGLTLWSSTQIPHYVHRTLARVLDLPSAQIRVIQPAVGGAFGGKSDPFSHEILVAKLAMMTGRPVKVLLTREETFFTHRGRHPMNMKMKLAADLDGHLTALDSEIVIDGGAYSSFGVVTTYYSGQLISAPTHVDAYRFKSQRYFTNKPPCGPKRGHGSVQPRFAFEIQLDKMARALDLCPIELRRRNDLGPDSVTNNGQRIGTNGFLACLDAVEKASGWSSRWNQLPFGHGLGVAGSMYISGTAYPIMGKGLPQSIVEIRIDRMGLIHVSCGASDIGQGSNSTLATIAADTLGVDRQFVRVTTGDTRLSPVDLGAYSSRITLMCGHACREAALLLRQRLEKSAIELLAAEHVVFELESGQFQSQSGESASWFDVVCYAEGRDGPLFAIGTYETDESLGGDYKGGSIGASPAYSFTAHVVEVKVDVETGHYDVVKIWAAHDCGRAVNPTLVEGQIQGSVYMGWSEAVMEEQAMVYGGTNPGLLRATNLLDYPLPTIVETPEIEAIIVESDDGQHGLGVKEAGEGPLHPVLPAIANAIFDAVGVRVDRLPIRASDLKAQLFAKGQSNA